MATSKEIEFDYYISPCGDRYAFTFEDKRHVFEYSGYGMSRVNYKLIQPAAARHPLPYDYELEPRIITLSHVVNGCDRCDYWNSAKRLSDLFRPGVLQRCLLHPGRLVKRLPDGSEFYFEVYIVEGPEVSMNSSDGSYSPFSWKGTLRFIAYDPHPKSVNHNYVPLAVSKEIATSKLIQRNACCDWINFDGGVLDPSGIAVVEKVHTGRSGRMYAIGRLPNGMASTPEANGMFYWQNGAWTHIGSIDINDPSDRALDVVESANGLVYFAGQFTSVNGVAVNNIASWDPVSGAWADVSGGVTAPAGTFATPTQIRSLSIDPVDGVSIWAAGAFRRANGIAIEAQGVARFDGLAGAWHPLSTYIGVNNGNPQTANVVKATLDGLVYVGGDFTNYYHNVIGSPNTGSAENVIVMRRDFTVPGDYRWSQLDGGLNGTVNAIVEDPSGIVYFGGEFTQSATSAQTFSHVASWNGSSYGDAFGGVNGPVDTLCASEDGLYAGGSFSMAGNRSALPPIAASNISLLTSGQWNAVPIELGNIGGDPISITSISCSNGKLTLAGNFVGISMVGGCTVFEAPCTADSSPVFVLNGPMTLYSIGNSVNNSTISFPPLTLYAGEQLVINLSGEIHANAHNKETRSPTFVSNRRGDMSRFVSPGSQSARLNIAANCKLNSISINAIGGNGSAYMCYRCNWWGPADCTSGNALYSEYCTGEPLVCAATGEPYDISDDCIRAMNALCAVAHTQLDDACSTPESTQTEELLCATGEMLQCMVTGELYKVGVIPA